MLQTAIKNKFVELGKTVLFGTWFEFKSPMPIEDCARRLQSKNEPWRLIRFTGRLRASVRWTDQNTCYFRLSRDANRNDGGEAEGYLDREPDGSTWVVGETKIPKTLILVIPVIVVLPFVLLARSQAFAAFVPLFVPVWLLIFAANFGSSYAEQKRLAQLVINALSANPALVRLQVGTRPEQPGRHYVRPFSETIRNWANYLVMGIGFVVVFVIFTSFGNDGFGGTTGNTGNPTRLVTPQTVLASSIPATMLWSARLSLTNSDGKPGILAASNLLVAADSNGLTAFGLQNGQTIWRVDGSHQIGGALTFDTRRNRIYAQKRRSGLVAISVPDGSLLWTSDSALYEGQIPYTFILDDGQVLVQLNGGLWFIDPDNGTLRGQSHVLNEYPLLVRQDGLMALGSAPTLHGYDYKTGALVWSLPVDRPDGVISPYLSGGLALMRFGNQPVAIDWHTGQPRWKLTGRDVVSNIVVDNNFAYMLDSEARLLRVNLADGTALGSVNFSHDRQILGGWVAVTGNIAAVYFQDSGMLSVVDLSGSSRR